jgi:lysyl-tRNA synthetase class 2
MGFRNVPLAATTMNGQPLPHDRHALVAFLVGLLVTFVLVRINTRLIRAHVSWWFHDITPGGKHIHHMVFGVVLMATAGLIEFSMNPTGWYLTATALAFGAGVALTMDEFALILNLDDVYWREEGRRSVDAVVVASAAALLFLLGGTPLLDSTTTTGLPVMLVVATVLANLMLSLLSFSKGKLWVGFIGLWIPLVSLVGSVRLARPGSPWARWRYRTRPQKVARAEMRFARTDARQKALRAWFYDLIAGKPSLPPLSAPKPLTPAHPESDTDGLE